MPFLLSATITRFENAFDGGVLEISIDGGAFQDSLALAAAFFRAVTMARSAPVAAIRWQVARRGQAVLVASSRQQWACPADIPACYGGEWAATTVVPVKAGGSILSR